tara:strand:+ start:314 stop:466 length:153 start_codon:yes stop_codon:yes gene_type:complete
MNKKGHTYEEDLTVEVEYTYEKKTYNKVYNIEKLRRRFENIIQNLKNQKS